MISIIVPIYNAEAYLDECLRSIEAQDYSDFECILVNDGSTDNSAAICERYAIKDTRFRVVMQKNGGSSAARNTGLREACGEYISFVDADDWVEPNFLSTLYQDIKANDADVSMCDILTDGKVEHPQWTDSVFRKGEILRQYLMGGGNCK